MLEKEGERNGRRIKYYLDYRIMMLQFHRKTL